MNRLSDESLKLKKDTYMSDPLFRELMPSLCMLERDYGEMNAVEVWLESDKVIEELKASSYPEYEVDIIYNSMYSDYETFNIDKKRNLTRTHADAVNSADTVMTVLLLRLSDASNQSADECPHKEICRHIALIICKHNRADMLLKLFRIEEDHNELRRGFVLPVTDYMVDTGSKLDNLSIEESDRVKQMVDKIIELTTSLQSKMALTDQQYTSLWTDICCKEGAIEKLNLREPRNQKWGNVKFVAGVLCLLQNTFVNPKDKMGETFLEANQREIALALGRESLRNYVNLDYLSKDWQKFIKMKLNSFGQNSCQ